MDVRVADGLRALSEKERQTLRLMVRGHDAKSIARSLGLSVHTINERLRDARRKLAVSSSREAARLLLEAEGGLIAPDPERLGDAPIGVGVARAETEGNEAPTGGARRSDRRPWIIGVTFMTLVLGLLALAALPQAPSAPPPAAAAAEAPNAEVVETARVWLMLVDAGRWDESYRATGRAFRKLNTAQVWAATSEKVRTPLGAMISRSFLSEEDLPAPPHGYEVVKFRTGFANRPDTVETVTLSREEGRWRVVGVTIG